MSAKKENCQNNVLHGKNANSTRINCLLALACFLLAACANGGEDTSADRDAASQWKSIKNKQYTGNYDFIDTETDTISSYWQLESFYRKLSLLQKDRINRVSIVHIGDSHLQTDLLSRPVRDGLQSFFGNAGRGLVFPYQVARTNGPEDLFSTSSSRWNASQLSYSKNNVLHGIAGFGMNRLSGKGDIHLSLRSEKDDFDLLRLFLGQHDVPSTWFINPTNSNRTYKLEIGAREGIAFRADSVKLTNSATGFTIYSPNAPSTRYFYGVSMEKERAGILYHSIGVNGAQLSHYLAEPHFWEQLPALGGDLFILSFGTNESFSSSMDEQTYLSNLQAFIKNIKRMHPKADILVTTAADAYINGGANIKLQRLNLALQFYCLHNNIALWDLYGITDGFGSAADWQKQGLMQQDGLHYQAKGYEVQGNLLFDALADGFNRYIAFLSRPAEAP